MDGNALEKNLDPMAGGEPSQVGRTVPPASTSFAQVSMRPEGCRYGDGDLIPGGSLQASSAMLANEHTFPPRDASGGRRPLDAAPFARYDPIFPGSTPQGGGLGRRAPFGAPLMPGEPDDDNLHPLQGRPWEAFGGPGSGQFGPRQGGWGPMGGGNGW